jgi:hypothetical protein
MLLNNSAIHAARFKRIWPAISVKYRRNLLQNGSFMRVAHAVLLLAVAASPAFAQERAPEIVIPGKPGVPVYINGIDASWGVVESDFGLDRPGMMTPTVVYRPIVVSYPSNAPGYHPTTGQRPGYGRLEIVPPPDRVLPPPAPTYYRSWSSGSASGPVTDYPSYQMPPVEISPQFGRRRSPKSNNSGQNHKGP